MSFRRLFATVLTRTCCDSEMITDDLSVTGCRYCGWIIVLIAKYEIIRERTVDHPSLGNDGRLSGTIHLSYSLSHHPLPIPIASAAFHCSYIGRNCPLLLITSCPRKRLRSQGIKHINMHVLLDTCA